MADLQVHTRIEITELIQDLTYKSKSTMLTPYENRALNLLREIKGEIDK